MERGHDRDRRDAGEQQAGPLEVAVDDVELVGVVEDGLDGQENVGQRVALEGRRAERLGHGRDVPARDVGIAAGECRDVMAAAVELTDELGDDRSVPP